MANICDYDLKVVGKTKEAVSRFAKILNYEDPDMCLSRVYEADHIGSPYEESGMFVVDICGTVPWSPGIWFDEKYRTLGERVVLENKKNPDGTTTPVYGGCITLLPEICKVLGVGVEIWAREFDGGYFEEHHIVNHKGVSIVYEEAEFDVDLSPDDHPEKPLRKGFGKKYGIWNDVKNIY